jgi:hypothetical protein
VIDNTSDIQSGMEVFGIDGEKIGTVSEVYRNGGFGTPSDTTWQAGSGVGELDVETVTIAETNASDASFRDPTATGPDYGSTTSDTSFRDPTAPGAGYGSTTTSDTSFSDPTAPGAGYGNPPPTGTTYTDPTSSDTGFTTGTPGFAGPTAPQTAGGGTATATSTGYFKVEHGGILGIGAKDLYIPFSAVTTTVPGQNVTIDCTKDECADRYSQKPDFLNDENKGTFT